MFSGYAISTTTIYWASSLYSQKIRMLSSVVKQFLRRITSQWTVEIGDKFFVEIKKIQLKACIFTQPCNAYKPSSLLHRKTIKNSLYKLADTYVYKISLNKIFMILSVLLYAWELRPMWKLHFYQNNNVSPTKVE